MLALPPAHTGKLLPAEAEAFQQLGRVLSAAVTPPLQASSAHPAIFEASAVQTHRKPQDIPFSVQAMLDKIPDALMLARDGEVLHGNAKALALFGYKTAYELINDEAIWSCFAKQSQALPPTALNLANGSSVLVSASMSLVPWQGGPVRQFTLHKAEASSQTASPVAIVAPAPERSESASTAGLSRLRQPRWKRPPSQR